MRASARRVAQRSRPLPILSQQQRQLPRRLPHQKLQAEIPRALLRLPPAVRSHKAAFFQERCWLRATASSRCLDAVAWERSTGPMTSRWLSRSL